MSGVKPSSRAANASIITNTGKKHKSSVIGKSKSSPQKIYSHSKTNIHKKIWTRFKILLLTSLFSIAITPLNILIRIANILTGNDAVKNTNGNAFTVNQLIRLFETNVFIADPCKFLNSIEKEQLLEEIAKWWYGQQYDKFTLCVLVSIFPDFSYAKNFISYVVQLLIWILGCFFVCYEALIIMAIQNLFNIRCAYITPQRNKKGILRTDRMVATIKKKLADPSELLIKARKELLKITGVTIIDYENLLTLEEELNIINHINDTFGKNGISFQPRTEIRIINALEKRSILEDDPHSQHFIGTNISHVFFEFDEYGDVPLELRFDGPRCEEIDSYCSSVLDTITHELAHQLGQNNKLKSLQKNKQLVKTHKLFFKKINKLMKFAKDYKSTEKDVLKNHHNHIEHIKGSVTKILENVHPVLQEETAIYEQMLDKGKINTKEFLGKIVNSAYYFPWYERITDSSGKDLYNRAYRHRQLTKGTDLNLCFVSVLHSPFVGNSQTKISSGGVTTDILYASKDTIEFYAETMEYYVHCGEEFRSKIRRCQKQAKQMKARYMELKDMEPTKNQKTQHLIWQARSDLMRQFIQESADILSESYQYMQKLFNGKEF